MTTIVNMMIMMKILRRYKEKSEEEEEVSIENIFLEKSQRNFYWKALNRANYFFIFDRREKIGERKTQENGGKVLKEEVNRDERVKGKVEVIGGEEIDMEKMKINEIEGLWLGDSWVVKRDSWIFYSNLNIRIPYLTRL